MKVLKQTKMGDVRPSTWKARGLLLVSTAAILIAGAAPAFSATLPLCASSTNCALELTLGNSSSGFGSGSFGTVTLSLSGLNTVTIDVNVAPDFSIVKTGFPGSIGFSDNLGGGLTIGNFSSSAYSGSHSDATNDLHFDGFGFFNNAVATTGPSAGSPLKVSDLSFTVTKAGLTDVNALLNLANPEGGDGAAYFVVDVYRNGTGPTGLIAVTGDGVTTYAPEPASLILLGTGLGLIGLGAWRRKK